MHKNKIHPPKQIFFDVNETLLDLSPLKEKISKMLGGGPELVKLWFTTLLQYSLVATVGDQYRDFGEIGAATLQMVARRQGLSLSQEKAREILKPIRSLPAHADVPEGLSKLKNAGYSLAAFSNSGNKALEEQMSHSGLKSYFDQLLSVEEIGLFKPHRRVYSWASRKMGVTPEESMMITAHGWDVTGAKWAGWQVAFISRPGHQLYPLAQDPEIIAPDLGEIANQLIAAKD